jgi:caa(3)-type oxidase subunit IV
MNRQHRVNLAIWVGLIVLAGLEFGASYLPLPPAIRPVLILPAVIMAALVSLYMRLPGAPHIARGFAVAGVFWLAVLLGLAMMDPMTRTFYAVTQ